MKDIINKLVRDLKIRLRGKKKTRPRKKEIERWGATRIPTVALMLLYGAYLAFALLGSPKELLPMPGWLAFLLFAWPGWVVFFFGLQSLHAALNRFLAVNAYRRLLNQHERFTLVEYGRFLERQIERATGDLSLGGQSEVKRLRALHAKLNALLRKGAGEDNLQMQSELSQEADLAEAVIESYESTDEDWLQGLDKRLPDELRQRIEELDQEADASRTRATE